MSLWDKFMTLFEKDITYYCWPCMKARHDAGIVDIIKNKL